MTHYKITIIYGSGKLEGQQVSFFKKRLDIALSIAEKYLSNGDSVRIEPVSTVGQDFVDIVLQVINEDL